MAGVTTNVAMTAATGVTTTGVITTTASTTTDEMIDAMIDVRTTTIATTIIGRNRLHHHCPKGQPQRCVLEGQP
jgi:hypothetical protein